MTSRVGFAVTRTAPSARPGAGAAGGRGGFTLVEVIAALQILAFGALGVAGMTVLASKALHAARDLDWAVVRAREVVDSLNLFGAEGAGSREYDRGRVSWSASGAVADAPRRLTASLRSRPSDPVLSLWFVAGPHPRAPGADGANGSSP